MMSTAKDTRSSLQSPFKKQTKLHSFPQLFNHIFLPMSRKYVSVVKKKSIIWTDEQLSLIVAWTSLVSISCFKVQSSIGHLVFFFTAETQKFQVSFSS